MLHPSLEADIDRLSALYRYGILDEPRDPFFQAVVEKMSATLGGMAVQVVLVDDHRLFTAATAGTPLEERGKMHSLAAATIEQMDPLVVSDLTKDARFAGNPSVVEAPRLRSYGAVALRTPEGHAIGALSIANTGALSFRPGHYALLERGAAHVMERLEARRTTRVEGNTGAVNREAFDSQMTALAGVATRHRFPLSVLAVDLRALRTLLQCFRADLGLLVIDRMSGLGRRGVRRVDAFGRLGENTFAILLPNTDEKGARILGRRIVEGLVAGLTLTQEDGRAAAPAGVGIATLRTGLDGTSDLIERAIRDARRAWLQDPAAPDRASQVA